MRVKLILNVVMLISLSATIRAERFNFSFVYRASEPGYKLAAYLDEFGVDSYDGEMALDPSYNPIKLAFYKTPGSEGWNGPEGFYTYDSRSPIPAGGTKVEEIYLWADPGTPSQNLHLYHPNGAYLPAGLNFKLTLVQIPDGITYTGPTQWSLNHAPITLPFYSTSDGTTGYKFRAEITAVPEPSSLLALAGGLAGMGGVIFRRRRR